MIRAWETIRELQVHVYKSRNPRLVEGARTSLDITIASHSMYFTVSDLRVIQVAFEGFGLKRDQ